VPVFSRSPPRGPLWLTAPSVSIVEGDALSNFLPVPKAGEGVEATGPGLAVTQPPHGVSGGAGQKHRGSRVRWRPPRRSGG